MLSVLMPPTYLCSKRECVVRIEKKIKEFKIIRK